MPIWLDCYYFQCLVELRDLVTHGVWFWVYDTSILGGPFATAEPAAHLPVHGSSHGFRVFAAIVSDLKLCWLCGNRIVSKISGA
jgi:hypothetical protein